jgi:hypothetical protein
MTSSSLQGSTLPTGSGLGAEPASGRRWKVRTGWFLTVFSGLFLLLDAAGKLVMPPQVVLATTRLGVPASLIPDVGILLLTCTILYLIPRTAVLGAIMITGFLGGAVAIQLRSGSPPFETLFPVILGVLVWAGIYLRECRLCALIPIRR